MATNLLNPSNTGAKVRFREPYVSDGLNKKLNGVIPAGVIRGGRLDTNLAALSVTVSADVTSGDSVYSYIDANGAQVTFRQTGDVTLDLTAEAVNTVYIALYISYSTASDTVVYWRAYSEAELFGGAPVAEADYVIVVGRVVVPGAGVIPAGDITPLKRREAWRTLSPCAVEWRQVVEEGGFESSYASAYSATADEWPGWLTQDVTAIVTKVNPSVSAAQQRSGAQSLKLALTGLGPAQQFYLPYGADIAVEPGQFADISIWVMGDTVTAAPAGGHLGVLVEFLTNVGGAVATVYVEDATLTGSFAWTEISEILEVPATARLMKIFVAYDDNGVAPTGDYYFDDIRVWVSRSARRDPENSDDYSMASIRAKTIDVSGPLGVGAGLVQSMMRFRQNAPSSGLLRLILGSRAGKAIYPFGLQLIGGELTIDRVIAALGGDLIGSASNAAIARLTSSIPDPANSAYVLLAHFPQADATKAPIRIYASGLSTLVTGNEFLFVTINAEWDDAGNQWQEDVAGLDHALIGIGVDGLYLYWYPSGGASPWAHAAWSSGTPLGESLLTVLRDAGGGTRALLNDALIRFIGATALTNPASGTIPLSNTLYAKNLPKAWCYFEVLAGVPAIIDAFNISGIALTGAPPNGLDVSFHTNMANANYGVVISKAEAMTNRSDEWLDKSAKVVGGFSLWLVDTAGAQMDLAARDAAGTFTVWGEQTS